MSVYNLTDKDITMEPRSGGLKMYPANHSGCLLIMPSHGTFPVGSVGDIEIRDIIPMSVNVRLGDLKLLYGDTIIVTPFQAKALSMHSSTCLFGAKISMVVAESDSYFVEYPFSQN
jgi:hypothetical protein